MARQHENVKSPSVNRRGSERSVTTALWAFTVALAKAEQEVQEAKNPEDRYIAQLRVDDLRAFKVDVLYSNKVTCHFDSISFKARLNHWNA